MEPAQTTRHEFIRAAVAFLQNPKLIDNPLQDKLKFLRDKGLSELEVDEAINLALISRNSGRAASSGRWNFLLVLSLCLGGYKLYQAYLESRRAHLSSASKQEPAPVVEAPAPVSLAQILESLGELKQLLERQRTDIQSLKTLMLSQHQFATPPVIPEWQMKKSVTVQPASASAANHNSTIGGEPSAATN